MGVKGFPLCVLCGGPARVPGLRTCCGCRAVAEPRVVVARDGELEALGQSLLFSADGP